MVGLIVDDEIVAVNALKHRVKWESYGITQVETANSMAQAQSVFEKSPVDLMLCDIEMPGGSGLELFEWVKMHYPQVECIYVTCHPDFEYIRAALRLGSLDYLLKPVDYEELDKILTDAVKRISQRKIKRTSGYDSEYPAANGITASDLEDVSDIGPVNQVKKYIHGHLTDAISIDDLADLVHLNSQYLMRLFRKETGLSILEYMTGLRIRRAELLLRTTQLSVSRVADLSGYGNYSYFIRLFRREHKMTPLAYREKYAGTDGAI